MTLETTFVMVKPDGVARGLVGEVIGRMERKGLQLLELRVLSVDTDLADRHYAEHRGKPFFTDLVEFITRGPSVAMAWRGEAAVAVVRILIGATNPKEASPGTIRGDYGLEITQNLVHGSDSLESAARELALFFPNLAP